jgi:hypothetical protein
MGVFRLSVFAAWVAPLWACGHDWTRAPKPTLDAGPDAPVVVTPFADPTRWAEFDLQSVIGLGWVAQAAAHDGLRVYIAYNTADDQSPWVARYEIGLPMNERSSWTRFNLATGLGQGNFIFGPTAFDGKYVYFTSAVSTSPGQPAPDARVFRYRIDGTLETPASWSVVDLSAHGRDIGAMVIGETEIYLAMRLGNQFAVHDLGTEFTDPGTWRSYTPQTAPAHGAGTFNGRFVYFGGRVPPVGEPTATIGYRYDKAFPFSSGAGWTSIDFGTIPGVAGARGMISDLLYVYYVPTFTTAVRLDTRRGFEVSAFSTIDLAPLVPPGARFEASTVDRDHVYFGGDGGPLIRFDLTKPFTEPSSWETSGDVKTVDVCALLRSPRYLFAVPRTDRILRRYDIGIASAVPLPPSFY